MISVKEVDAQKFNSLLKEELKKMEGIVPPEWSRFVKSGVHRQRPPQQTDFWYIRSASILRRLYIDGPVGVERLTNYFGGRKNRGHKPSRFRKSSGNIIRKILHQLEAAELVEKSPGRKGRKLAAKGIKVLDRISHEANKI